MRAFFVVPLNESAHIKSGHLELDPIHHIIRFSFVVKCLLFLLFSWLLFCEVCPNYEVVMLQHHKGTPPDLGSVGNCYVAFLLIPAPPFPPATRCPLVRATRSCPFPLSLSDLRVPTQDHLTTQASPVSVPTYLGPSLLESGSATSPPPPPF